MYSCTISGMSREMMKMEGRGSAEYQIVFLLHLNQGQNVKLGGGRDAVGVRRQKMVILERESLTSL